MAKFMFVYRGSDEEFAKKSPEEPQKHMQQWGYLDRRGPIHQGVVGGRRRRPHSRGPVRQLEDGRHRWAFRRIQGSGRRIIGCRGAHHRRCRDNRAKGCPGLQTGGIVEVRTLAGLSAKP